MKSTQALPDNYKKILTVDLQNDKKLAVLVNLLAFLLGVALIVVRIPFLSIPLPSFSTPADLLPYFLRLLALFLGICLYIILHEATHGVVMRAFGAKHVRFGFTGLYAYAGSKEDYFGKKAYLVIALSPVLLFGVLLLLLDLLLPIDDGWRWVIYLIQVQNLSGAAGDLYVTLRFLSLPSDILVYDEGTAMRVYARSKE